MSANETRAVERPTLSGAGTAMPRFAISQRHVVDAATARAELSSGLLEMPATIPPKYFYDAQGCALFAAICELDEYYLPRAEREIFARYRRDIAAAAGRQRQLVDLGAGDGAKARDWFADLAPTRYVAVDIAEHAIRGTLARFADDFPAVALAGVVADFAHGLDLAPDLGPEPATFFYPGSSIGNFDPANARAFLANIHGHCQPRPGSALLIGVDTRKEARRLDAAYDDAIGVTAAFNRNVLRHLNVLLGADFRPEVYAHVAFYNADAGRVEMYLEATTHEVVSWEGASRAFTPGERILTEYSYKYAPDEFAGLLAAAGFGEVRCWQDAARDFAVFVAA